MPGISVTRIPIGFNKVSGGLSPSVLAKALYYGRIADISGGHMPNRVTGATDYITVGGSAGSYTFKVPEYRSLYRNADTDYIWHSTSLAWRTVTEAEIVGYDFPRTPVYFNDDVPNSFRELLILKAGETLTADELINVHHNFRLPILWSGVWVDEGYEKSNRGIAQQYIWTLPPENVTCSLDGSDIKIDWDDVANNEDGYFIERSTDNITFAEIDTVTAGVETYTDETPEAETLYYYRLRTYKDGIYSSCSNTDSETTPAGIPSQITDGNTVAWYVADDLTTITKDGSNLVSRWNDKLESGHDLLQSGADTLKPVWGNDGVLFNDPEPRGLRYLKAAPFTLNQPTFIYAVVRYKIYVGQNYLFDGNSGDTCMVYMDAATGPSLKAYAGDFSPSNTNLAVNTWGIIRVLYSGASSKFGINTSFVTGNFGAGNAGGFILGASGYAPGTTLGSYTEWKEIIIRKV